MYGSDDSNTCVDCNNACSCCSASGSDSCTECHVGSYLLNGECVIDCGEGYYGNTIDNTCDPCDGSCKTCYGPDDDNCNTCHEEHYIRDNSCHSPCPDGMWENATPTVPSCDDCHARCALCEDDTYKDCDKCNDDYFLLDR
jgi:proprotein convertase subtilisin/kexin type 5